MANDRGTGTNYLIVGVSVLLIVALMGWLFMKQEDRAAARSVAADTTSAATPQGAPPAHVVTDTVYEQNVASYVGQIVQVTNAKFSSGLSPQTFWLELPSGAPYMVKLSDAMVAAGTPVPTSGVLTIIGTVQNKDAALAAQWQQQGVLQNDDQRMQAEFGTTYIEAREIRPAGQ